MRPFFAAIIFADSEYSEIVSAELSLRRPDWTILCGGIHAETAQVIVTDDETLWKEFPEKSILTFGMRSAEELLSMIEERKQDLGLEPSLVPSLKKEESCIFTLMTAAGGGQGLSTCALLLGEYYACFQEEKVLYLSLDALVNGLPERPSYDSEAVDPATGEILEQKQVPPVLERLVCRAAGGLNAKEDLRFLELLRAGIRKDSKGLSFLPQPAGPGPLARLSVSELLRFLSLVAGAGFFQRVVLDVPCSFSHLSELAEVCEEVILVQKEDARAYSQGFLEAMLSDKAQHPLEILKVSHDEYASGLDLYGQLGWEVMDFAKKR